MKRTVRILVPICTLMFLAAVMHGFAQPDFTGTWKMNASKSQFGPMPAPDSVTLKVEHKDPNLKTSMTTVGGPQGDQTVDAKYTTDGKECVNSIMGTDAKSKVTWDGDAMVTDTKVDFGGAEITLKAKWTLSSDGKVLTNAQKISTPQGEFEIVYVFDKQ